MPSGILSERGVFTSWNEAILIDDYIIPAHYNRSIADLGETHMPLGERGSLSLPVCK